MTTPDGRIVIETQDARAVRAHRTTRETDVDVVLRLDGAGEADVQTGVGAYDHLLGSMAHHGLLDLRVRATGDLHVDEHHTVEDVALVLGSALAAALGDRAGIVRFGDASVPMDESLATAVVDVGGRPYAVIDLPFRGERMGGLPLQLVPHALEALSRTGGLTLPPGRGPDGHSALGEGAGQATSCSASKALR